MGYEEFQPPSHLPALKYGRLKEPEARESYKKSLSDGHINAGVEETGLHVHATYQYIAASPDGLVSCSCTPSCGAGLVEIKCPPSIAGCHPTPENYPHLIIINGKVTLNPKDPYYTQIQMQLGVTGRRWCDFFVYTGESTSFVERIDFNTNSWNKIKEACIYFFNNALVNELIMHTTSPSHNALPFPSSVSLPSTSGTMLPSPSHNALPLPSSVSLPSTSGTVLPSPSHNALSLPSSVSLPSTSGTVLPSPSHNALPLPSSVSLPSTSGTVLPSPSHTALSLTSSVSLTSASSTALPSSSHTALPLPSSVSLPSKSGTSLLSTSQRAKGKKRKAKRKENKPVYMCGICNEQCKDIDDITDKDEYSVCCEICRMWHHYICVKFDPIEYEDEDWICTNCIISLTHQNSQ
ncbi:uncharacterized protein [Amphiura filiformis]|uniref:uncharacterized protein n=1 Tax=Amphiura filiformis TaxID=82378 RepID=UPI003B2190D6